MAGFSYSFATLSETGKIEKHTVNITAEDLAGGPRPRRLTMKEAPPGASLAKETKKVVREKSIQEGNNDRMVPGGGWKS